MDYGFICGHCDSRNVFIIQTWRGEFVIPDPKGYCDSGIVVQCKECGDITGYLIEMTGVIPADQEVA